MTEKRTPKDDPADAATQALDLPVTQGFLPRFQEQCEEVLSRLYANPDDIPTTRENLWSMVKEEFGLDWTWGEFCLFYDRYNDDLIYMNSDMPTVEDGRRESHIEKNDGTDSNCRHL